MRRFSLAVILLCAGGVAHAGSSARPSWNQQAVRPLNRILNDKKYTPWEWAAAAGPIVKKIPADAELSGLKPLFGLLKFPAPRWTVKSETYPNGGWSATYRYVDSEMIGEGAKKLKLALAKQLLLLCEQRFRAKEYRAAQDLARELHSLRELVADELAHQGGLSPGDLDFIDNLLDAVRAEAEREKRWAQLQAKFAEVLSDPRVTPSDGRVLTAMMDPLGNQAALDLRLSASESLTRALAGQRDEAAPFMLSQALSDLGAAIASAGSETSAQHAARQRVAAHTFIGLVAALKQMNGVSATRKEPVAKTLATLQTIYQLNEPVLDKPRWWNEYQDAVADLRDLDLAWSAELGRS